MNEAVQSLRDIHGPVAIRPDWWWLLVALLALLVAGAVWAIVVFLRHRQKNVPPSPPKPAWQVAFEAMDKLEHAPLALERQVKEYYAALSDVIRQYIEALFLIRAPEMTTQEFMAQASRSEKLSDAQKGFLRDFLDASDMVKFAKFLPPDEEARKLLHLARRFVEETRPVVEEEK